MEAEDGTRQSDQSGRLIGYARVSSLEQNLDLQVDELKSHGCELVFTDKVSGAKSDRPGLNACLAELIHGDTLLLWRIDRLGRSMAHLVSIVEELRERGVGFRSIQDGAIDTTTASGELVFNIFSSLAQFERRLIQERTKAGLAAARARGRKGGRKPISAEHPRVQAVIAMHRDNAFSIGDICQTLKISRTSFYRYLAIGKKKAAS